MDEKWSFVRKKEVRCAAETDFLCGDNRDHVALDPEHRLFLPVVNGNPAYNLTRFVTLKRGIVS